jgi:hypothetical protein
MVFVYKNSFSLSTDNVKRLILMDDDDDGTTTTTTTTTTVKRYLPISRFEVNSLGNIIIILQIIK